MCRRTASALSAERSYNPLSEPQGVVDMKIFKAVARCLIGVVFGLACVVALSPAFAAFIGDDDTVTPIVMAGVVLGAGFLAMLAPTIRRAFGRGFLMLGASVFALPISSFLLAGRAAHEMVGAAEEGTEALSALGAGLAGAAVTGVATFVGLILGSILFVIGLVLCLGGKRTVVIDNRYGDLRGFGTHPSQSARDEPRISR